MHTRRRFRGHFVHSGNWLLWGSGRVKPTFSRATSTGFLASIFAPLTSQYLAMPGHALPLPSPLVTSRDTHVSPLFFARVPPTCSLPYPPPHPPLCPSSLLCLRARLAPPPLADFFRRGISPGPPPQGAKLQEVRDQARQVRPRPAPPEAQEPRGPQRRPERLHGRRGGGAAAGVGRTEKLVGVFPAGEFPSVLVMMGRGRFRGEGDGGGGGVIRQRRRCCREVMTGGCRCCSCVLALRALKERGQQVQAAYRVNPISFFSVFARPLRRRS